MRLPATLTITAVSSFSASGSSSVEKRPPRVLQPYAVEHAGGRLRDARGLIAGALFGRDGLECDAAQPIYINELRVVLPE
jgi:hypothetical protein